MANLSTASVDVIPVALRDLPQWVLWKYEGRGEDETKIPYDAKNHHMAKTDNAATWSDFQFTHDVWKNRRADFAGLGFFFRKRRLLRGRFGRLHQ